MARYPKAPEEFYQEILNTLEILSSSGFVLFFQKPEFFHGSEPKQNRRFQQILCANHQAGEFGDRSHFNSIEQYREYLKLNSYFAILFDGSIVRGSYQFEDGFLVKHGLTYWPAPVRISPADLEVMGVLDVVDSHLAAVNRNRYLVMRTPVCFDFDSENARANHPQAHSHMQNKETRIKIPYPTCLAGFLHKIFCLCYSDTVFSSIPWAEMNFVKLKTRPEAGSFGSELELFFSV